MNGNNKEKNKDELKHHEDKNSKNGISKQDIEELSKGDDTSKLAEILEDKNIPRKTKERITEFMSIGRFPGSFLSPLESKINEKHIDKILDIKGKYEDNIFRDTQSARKFHLIYILVAVALFIFLTLFLVSNDKDLFKEIIKLFIIFVGGFGAGYGIKSYKDNR
jgi:hypothetical protein